MARRPLSGNPRISCNHACHLARGSAGGTDYAVGVGTPIYAPFDGHVTRHTGGTGGWRVQLRNPKTGHDFWALHLSGWVAASGAQVKEGELIARSGGAPGHPGSGLSTGPHLHVHVNVNGVRWGMEEYLASPAGGGGNAIKPKKKGDDMKLVRYTKGNRTTWARFTGFGILETQNESEANRWMDVMESPKVRTSNASLVLAWWADEAAQNIAAIAASVGQPVVDIEALGQSIAEKLDFGSIVEDVAEAVDTALADDFANVPVHTIDALRDRL